MSSPSRTSHHEEDGSRTPHHEESGSQTPQHHSHTPAQQIESETTTPRRQRTSGRRTPAHRQVRSKNSESYKTEIKDFLDLLAFAIQKSPNYECVVFKKFFWFL
jgi:hypothetical protein